MCIEKLYEEKYTSRILCMLGRSTYISQGHNNSPIAEGSVFNISQFHIWIIDNSLKYATLLLVEHIG